MSKLAYYHQHEKAYQDIRARGGAGWQMVSMDEFRDEKAETFIRKAVSVLAPTREGKRALDLGCGSGPIAHILDDLGYTVTGVDVSLTAVEMAQEIASRAGKKIRFVVGDALSLDQLGEKYDVIYDSRCIHCIVLEKDRAQALAAIRGSLNPEGRFLLDTMVFSENYAAPDALRFDQQYILWHKTKDPTMTGVTEIDGQLWCPQRRIYPEPIVFAELEAAGFRVIESIVESQDPGMPSLLRAVCTPA